MKQTASNLLSLDKTLTILASRDEVDGLALFGSRLQTEHNPISDYDLLILVEEPPVRIFQMLTHIDGRMADVVFVETALVDDLLAHDDATAVSKRQGYLIQKMLKAEVIYDASGRLAATRQNALAQVAAGAWPLETSPSDQYAAWFWQNHGLFHVKRMAQSDDPVYGTATDMMMLNGLASICRSYFEVRHLPWEGEKAAIRHLMAADPEFLAQFRACLAEQDRAQKVAIFESLVERALAPAGALWQPGTTSVYLADAAEQPDRVGEALVYWDSLLCES